MFCANSGPVYFAASVRYRVAITGLEKTSKLNSRKWTNRKTVNGFSREPKRNRARGR